MPYKPKSLQGFEVTRIINFVPSSFSETGHAYQKDLGFGVNGPSLQETSPAKLRKIASFLLSAARYIEEMKADERAEKRKQRG